MGGYFQEEVTITDTADGSGEGNATAVINLPFRAGFLCQVMVDLSSGDASNFSFNLFEADNAGTPYTTETNQHRIKAVADAARTEYETRQDHSFFVASATEGSDNTKHTRKAITVYLAYTGATNASTVVYKVKVGGIGIS